MAFVVACGGKSEEPEQRGGRSSGSDAGAERSSSSSGDDDAGVPGGADAEPEPSASDDDVEIDPGIALPGDVTDEPDVGVNPGPEVAPEPEAPDPEPSNDAEPEPDPETPEPETPAVVEGDPVLAYVGGSVQAIYDARSGTRWADVGVAVDASQLAPWSPDGRWLATVEDDTLVFSERGEAAFEPLDVSVPTAGNQRRWVGSLGVLTKIENELWFVSKDGESVRVSNGSEGAIAAYSAAPDGRHFVFSTNVEGTFRVHRAEMVDGLPAAPELIGDPAGSPLLSPMWSSDGNWVVIGISAVDASGVFAVPMTAGEDLFSVLPDGASYNPLYSFAPDRPVLAAYTTLSSGPVVGVIRFDDPEPSWQTLLTNSTSPAYWIGSEYLHTGLTPDGVLVPVAPDGTAGAPIAFGPSIGCEPIWTEGDDVYFRNCADEPEVLRRGRIDGQEIVSEPVVSWLLASTVVSPDLRCLVTSDGATLAVGSLAPDFRLKGEFAAPVAETVRFATDGTGVVWAEASGAMWLALDERCVPVGEPRLVVGGANPVPIVMLP